MSEPHFPQPVRLTDTFTMVPNQKPRRPLQDLDATTLADYFAFANCGSVDAQVFVKAGDGHVLLPGITVPAGQLTVVPISEGGLLFPQGIWWKASVANVVDAWSRIILAAEKTG